MDELARGTGGLLTEATVSSDIVAVMTHTRPETVRRARTMLARIVPFRDWIRERPRTPDAIAMYRRMFRELGATIAGFRPDTITVNRSDGTSQTATMVSDAS